MKKFLSKIALAVGLFCVAAVSARAGGPVNVDGHGVAIKGYDPVAFFTDHKAVKGDEKLHSNYQGATYDFASVEHKAAFDQDPAKYAPQFGGYCAYGVSQGHKAPIEPDAFQIVDGRLLLQYNAAVRDKFNQDQPGNLKKADGNWPAIAEGKGK